MQEGDRVFVTSACSNGEIINVRKGKYDVFLIKLDDGRTFSTYYYDLRLLHPPKSTEEKSPEEKSPEQMFPEEKLPAPKFKVGDAVHTWDYGLCTIHRYDTHSNTYDVVDNLGHVRGEFKEKELTSAGTCTTPKEQKEMTQKETPQKETPSPKKNFEVGDKVRVTPCIREPFDATVTGEALDCYGEWIYAVLPNNDNAIFEASHREWWRERFLEKKEMSCCKENPVQILEQIPATEISLQDAYERIRRELERNPLYYNAWKDKLTRQIENYLGAEFADDDIYKILADLFKLAKPTATFDSFH